MPDGRYSGGLLIHLINCTSCQHSNQPLGTLANGCSERCDCVKLDAAHRSAYYIQAQLHRKGWQSESGMTQA
jgi:hypothetical protein